MAQARETLWVEIKGKMSDLKDTLNRAGKGVSAFKDKTANMAKKIGDFGKRHALASAAVTAGFAKMVQGSTDFESGMRKAATVTGGSYDEMKRKVLEMAKTSVFTTGEAAQAVAELGQKGFSAAQALDALPGVLSAAAASGSDLATASNVVTSAVNAFGLEAKDATRVADILTVAANASAADISTMGESFKYAAPMAKVLGIGIEELSAATGILADQGLEGSQIGTSLRMAFTKLAKPTTAASNLMAELGFNAFDANGKMKPLNQVIDELNKALAGMSEQQKIAALSTIFGTESAGAMLMLLDAGGDTIRDFSKKLEESGGASQKAADKMLDGWAGAIERLKSTWDVFESDFVDALAPAIEAVADFLQKVVDGFTNMSPEAQKTIAIFAGVAGAIVAVIPPLAMLVSQTIFLHKKIGKSVKYLKKPAKWLLSEFAGLEKVFGNIFRALKGQILGLGGVLKNVGSRMVAAFAANPILLVVAAIAAVVAGLVILYKKNETFRNFVNDTWDTIKTTALEAWETIKTKVTEVWNGLTEGIGEAVEVIQEVWSGVSEFFSGLWEGVTEIFSTYWENLTETLTAVWEGIVQIAQGLWEMVKTVIMAPILLLIDLLTGDWEQLSADLSLIWESIQAAAGLIWSGIKQVVLSYFQGLWQNLLTTAELIKTGLAAAWDFVKTQAVAVFSALKQFVVNIFNSIRQFVVQTAQKMVDKAVSVWRTMVDKVKSIIDSVKRVFRSLSNIRLADIGRAIMDSFLSGLKAAWGKVQNFVSGIGSWIRQHKGPIEKDRRLLIPAGQAIMTGFRKGLSESFKKVQNDIRTMTGQIDEAFDHIMTTRDMNVNFNPQWQGSGRAQMAATHHGYQRGDLQTITRQEVGDVMVRVVNELDGKELSKGTYRYTKAFIDRDQRVANRRIGVLN